MNIIAMNKLTDLYSKRKVFEEYGAEIPETLAAEIKDMESAIFGKVNDAVMAAAPLSLELEGLGGNVMVVLEYTDGILSRIGSGIEKKDIFSDLDMTVLTVDDGDDEEDEEDDEPDVDNPEHTRSRSRPFAVKFPDGKVYKYNKAQWTLIDSLRHMGLERASHFTGEMFRGFPLVGKRKRDNPKGQLWQKEIDGWWIYVNMSNVRKIKCLEGVAKMLDIPITIESLEP